MTAIRIDAKPLDLDDHKVRAFLDDLAKYMVGLHLAGWRPPAEPEPSKPRTNKRGAKANRSP